MILIYEKRELQLKETFSIAYGDYKTRYTLLIQLREGNQTGYGECVEINYYGIHLDSFISQLQMLKPFIENLKIVEPNLFYEILKSQNLHSFLLSALDCAYWDLYGKLENKSFIELNSIETSNLVESSYTISIAPVEEQIKKIKQSKWSKFKVKQKGFDRKTLERLLTLDIPISLDANASFRAIDCEELQETKSSEKLIYIEQPLEIGNYNKLRADGFANWMADEDVQNIFSLEKIQPHYNSINIKLMKCGGLTPALGMISKAKDLGFKVMLGCMTESSVGISAACALSGLLDFADLDGANLIANDFAKGSYVENGKIKLSEKPGLGIELL